MFIYLIILMMTQRYNKYPKKKSFKGNIFDYFT